jgi:ATP-dependent Clp protease ATP-binding subunit ClpA
MEVEFAEGAIEHLAEVGYDPEYGARPLRRAIQRRILNPLAARVLMQELNPGDAVFVDARDGEFVIASRTQVAVEANGAARSRRRKAAETAG